METSKTDRDEALLVHEASMDELVAEIQRRTKASIVVTLMPNGMVGSSTEAKYSYSGGVYAAHGLAMVMEKRLRESAEAP